MVSDPPSASPLWCKAGSFVNSSSEAALFPGRPDMVVNIYSNPSNSTPPFLAREQRLMGSSLTAYPIGFATPSIVTLSPRNPQSADTPFMWRICARQNILHCSETGMFLDHLGLLMPASMRLVRVLMGISNTWKRRRSGEDED